MKLTSIRKRAEKGTMLVLIAAGAVAIMGAAALAVDIGYFFTVRNQLQNAADAAALAAVQGLIADPGNYADNGTAKRWAIETAAKNLADGQPVILTPADILFPNPSTARVNIQRTVDTFLGRAIGITSADLKVTAKAVPSEAISGAVLGNGLRPWAIFDQFGHGSLCVPFNDCEVNPTPHGEFKNYPHTWNGVTVQSDHYKSPYDPEFNGWDLSSQSDCGQVTGLINPRDVNGTRYTLKQFASCNSGKKNNNGNGNGNNNSNSNPWLTPGNYGAVALGSNGASTYRENIRNGYQGLVQIGDLLPTEPGNMVGPTSQGVNDLIAKDPSAYMVRNAAGRWVVMSPNFPVNESPRIVPIPLYSYAHSPGNGRSNFKVTNIAFFFVEGSNGRDVWGRFVASRCKVGERTAPSPNAGTSTVSGGGRMVLTGRLTDQ